jgi:hypothetical protein
VLTVEINKTKRPLALPAACVRVPGYLSPSAAAVHALTGLTAARLEEQISGTTLIQVQAPQGQVQGTNGFAVKVSAMGMDPVGGVRGKPPRGWPV